MFIDPAAKELVSLISKQHQSSTTPKKAPEKLPAQEVGLLGFGGTGDGAFGGGPPSSLDQCTWTCSQNLPTPYVGMHSLVTRLWTSTKTPVIGGFRAVPHVKVSSPPLLGQQTPPSSSNLLNTDTILPHTEPCYSISTSIAPPTPRPLERETTISPRLASGLIKEL